MRTLGRTLRAMPSVTGLDLLRLGMNVPDGRRKTVPAPIDKPWVILRPPQRRTIPVNVLSTLTPERRGLPRDVFSVQVFGFAGDVCPTPLSEWQQLGTFSKARFNVSFNFGGIRSGETLWIVAHYANAKSQAGPLSNAVCTYAVGPAVMQTNLVRIPGRAA